MDRSDGETVADLGPMPSWSDVRVTEDGWIVVLRNDVGDHHAEVFSPDGEPVYHFDLPEAGWTNLGAEVARGKLVVGHVEWVTDEKTWAHRDTSLLDLNEGSTEVVLEGFSPILGRWMQRTSAGAWSVGSTASRLVEGEDGSLHLWDPDTGELEQLIPVPR